MGSNPRAAPESAARWLDSIQRMMIDHLRAMVRLQRLQRPNWSRPEPARPPLPGDPVSPELPPIDYEFAEPVTATLPGYQWQVLLRASHAEMERQVAEGRYALGQAHSEIGAAYRLARGGR